MQNACPQYIQENDDEVEHAEGKDGIRWKHMSRWLHFLTWLLHGSERIWSLKDGAILAAVARCRLGGVGCWKFC